MDFLSDTFYGSRSARVLLDTGSGVDVISHGLAQQWGLKVDPSKKKLLKAFNGQPSYTVGTVELFLVIGFERYPIRFDAIKSSQPTVILSHQTLAGLGIEMKKGRFYSETGEPVGREEEFLTDASKSCVVNALESLGSPLQFGLSVEPGTKSVKRSFEAEIRAVIQAKCSPNLENVDRVWLKDLLTARKGCFATKGTIGLLPKGFEYRQNFTSGPPSAILYPLSAEKTRVISDEIKSMTELGVLKYDPDIEVVTSQFLVVKKKSGEWRSVIDLRMVNAVTALSNKPLPKIETLLQRLSGNRWYFSADISKAYWQVSIPEDQQLYYTTVDPSTGKTYKYQRLPMGHCNAASSYQTFMSKIFGNLPGGQTSVYIDDIAAGYATKEEAKAGIAEFFRRVDEVGLKLNLQKSEFLVEELKVFGFLVNRAGITADPDRVEKLKELPFPSTKKQLLAALATFNYFRSCVPAFSRIASSLYELTSINSEFQVTEKHRQSFDQLKAALSKAVLLEPIIDGDTFVVESDASIEGTAGLLKQIDKNGKERLIAVTSGTLVGAQRLWAIDSLEMLGIFRAVSKFEQYLDGRTFLIRTDNTACLFILGTNIEKVVISKRSPASRCLLYLSQFSYRVEHVSATDPKWLLTDYLSRLGNPTKWSLQLSGNSKEPLVSIKVETDRGEETKEIGAINFEGLIAPDDRDQIFEKVKLGQSTSRWVQQKKLNPGNFVIQNELVYRIDNRSNLNRLLLCVPPHLARGFCSQLHLPTHLSARQLLEKIQNLGYWVPTAVEIVSQVLAACDACGAARSHKIQPTSSDTAKNPRAPWAIVGIDLLHVGRDRAVLILVDHFSSFTILRSLADQSAKSVQKGIFETFTLFGIPSRIVSDNGKNVKTESLERLLDLVGCSYSTASPYNSRGNSTTERKIQEVQKLFRIHQPSNDETRQFLDTVQFILNNTKQKGSAYTPAEIFLARSSRLLGLPELSQMKLEKVPISQKALFQHALAIRDETTRRFQKRIDELKGQAEAQRFKKGDSVRIKKVFQTGETKKLFQPFSELVFRVVESNRFTKTCKLRQILEEGDRSQPIQLIRSHRFLHKVKRPTIKQTQKEEEDYFLPPDGAILGEDNTKMENGENKEATMRSDKEPGNEDMLTKDRRKAGQQDAKSSGDDPKEHVSDRRTHKMTLRSRVRN